MQLRQRLMRLEVRRLAAPVGAGDAVHVVRYLPTDPDELAEIAGILLRALAGPEEEVDVEAGTRAVVAHLVGLHDVLGEEGYRRYGDLLRRRARLDAAEAAEFARLRARAGPLDLAVDDEDDGYDRASALL